MTALPCTLRKLLDGLYRLSGALSAIFMVAILLIITAQIVLRALGIPFPGSTDYAGYMMAAASFLAFSYTLNRGGHVRVGLLLNVLNTRRYLLDTVCHLIGSVFSCLLAWHASAMVYWSYMLGDVSQGQDATPLWIVQTPVALGAIILAICFLDNLVSILLRRKDNIVANVIE